MMAPGRRCNGYDGLLAGSAGSAFARSDGSAGVSTLGITSAFSRRGVRRSRRCTRPWRTALCAAFAAGTCCARFRFGDWLVAGELESVARERLEVGEMHEEMPG